MADKPRFYECEICCANHPWDWNGDCREDAAQFSCEDLDAKYGPYGYELMDMASRVNADLGKNDR